MSIPHTFRPLGRSHADVTLVDYLETTGTQYIDTDIPANTIVYAEIEHYHTVYFKQSACGWGAADDISSNPRNAIKYAAGNGYRWWSFRGAEARYGEAERLRTVVDVGLGSMQAFSSDGTIRINIAAGGNPITTRKFWLFLANCETSYYAGTLRIYRAFFRLTDGKEIDLRPALANGEPCMVDLNSGKIYRNAGTGNFNIPI